MQDKMKTLLDKIELENDYYHYFDDAIITKVEVDKTKNTWLFRVDIENMLPVFVYEHTLKLLHKQFTDIKKISVVFNAKNENKENIKEYFDNILDKLSENVFLLDQFKEHPLTFIENELILEVYNKVEQLKIEKLSIKIEEKLFNYGFKDIQVKTKINKEMKDSILKEIEDTKEIKINKDTKKKKKTIIIGRDIKGKAIPINSILGEDNNITIECNVFAVDFFESVKTSFKIVTLKVTDFTDSMYVKIFTKTEEEYNNLKKDLKVGLWLKINGYTKNDVYSKALVLNARDINVLDKTLNITEDKEEVKRVELHAHTHMSQMDSVINVTDLINRAKHFGHKAVAITDHNSLQSYPEAFNNAKDIKIIYGVELNLIDDDTKAVFNEQDLPLEDTTYVVFDFETTGLNASGGDSIIEVGGVKLLNGEIIDRFSELIDPLRLLPPKITEITGITNDNVRGKRIEEVVMKDFMEWVGDLPMVAHNAKFDGSFVDMCFKKYDMGKFSNVLIDTLELSRMLEPNEARHNLSALVRRYDISFDESSHHRADYDAEGTAMIFTKMIKKLVNRNIERVSEIKSAISEEDSYKISRPYHINVLVQNDVGLKNLFKLISYATTKYFYKVPRILRSELEKHREGLLFGSSCASGEVFDLARSKSDEELVNIMRFYDYIEVQPLGVYDHLIQQGDFQNIDALRDHILKIIKVAKQNNQIVVATGDVHHLTKADKIYRQIIINQNVPGGGRHPLNRKEITNIPSQHFRTTKEMLEDFAFLEKEEAFEIVVTNTNKISDMIEKVSIIKENGGNPFTPKMENSDKETKEIVYNKAHLLYGSDLPKIVSDRLEKELSGIINGGFDVIYLISQKLVKKSNDEGFIVGSRGSVGSSLVATMMDITEVNPLPAHYLCPKCQTSIFEIDGEPLGTNYSSGYDLPNKKCTCGTLMIKEGNDMPFETFLGFNADKVPDIDLNFDSEYQNIAHDYTKELFGDKYVFRAGTIGTVADKTAYGYVKGYMEDKSIVLSQAEIERLAIGCVGVKRTTGQHPGGIIVVPDYMDIWDFSPYQYPADDVSSKWYTTHFDFNSMHDTILKLDILGHDDPTTIRMLQKLTGVKLEDIPFDDQKVFSLFSSPNALGVTKEQINCETGTLGVPEFGTKFVISMLTDTKPKTFGELVKISGLSHGTDVWKNNAELLIKDKVCEFKEVIGCRDDIMVYLMYHGLEPLDAFKIMEFVRKGKPSKEPDAWLKWATIMKEKGIADWYIESCKRIKYMFPKAHATAYVMSGYRIAWFKVHHPIHYYAAYFSVRATDFDLDAMIKGSNIMKAKIADINNKGYSATNKETGVKDVLDIALEMVERGFKFGNANIYKSDAKNFIVDEDGITLIPPFRSIDGLGNIVAQNIVRERQEKEFLSIEDLQKRGKVSATLIDKMRIMGMLDGMPESAQLTLF